jgi:hypothetical protein
MEEKPSKQLKSSEKDFLKNTWPPKDKNQSARLL